MMNGRRQSENPKFVNPREHARLTSPCSRVDIRRWVTAEPGRNHNALGKVLR